MSVQDPSKIIFNFSKYQLSDVEKKLFGKELNFSLLSKYLDYADYFLNFELFYRNICNLGFLSNEDLDFVKATTKETVLTSYRNYSNNILQPLCREEFLGFQNLCKNKDIIIQNRLFL